MLVVPTRLLCAWLTRDDAEARPAVDAVVELGLVVAPPMLPVLVVGLVVALVPMRPLVTLAVGRVVAPDTCADERVVAPPRPLTIALLLLIEPAVLLLP